MGSERAEAIRSLASSLRAGQSLRAAVASWDAPAPDIRRVARRLKLGSSLADALEVARPFFDSDLDALILVVKLHARAGGDGASLLEAIARSIDERVAGAGRAQVHAAGARLSARMVAGLPLAALLFVPGSRAPLLDPAGIGVIGLGILLCLAGMMWMGRLLPRPPTEADEATLLAVAVAAAARAGCTVAQVLGIAAESASGSFGAELRRARRRNHLGLAWPRCLAASSDEGLRELGRVLSIPARVGLPLAEGLDDFVLSRADLREQELERAIRRAPVKMVVPLTLCILPAFGLLALTPFLRGLAPV
ncbi:MAG: type II secretion system F family protein [Actinomycetota bacterium]